AAVADRRGSDDRCPARNRLDRRRCRGSRVDAQRSDCEAARQRGRSGHGAAESGEFPRLPVQPVSSPAPLLGFFKRGEVARDVRLLAAQGVLAPRAGEQLEILALLIDDADPEIRDTAERTLSRIPLEALQTFLGRSDVSIGLREFFADRGIFPVEIPTIIVPDDEPLVEAAGADAADLDDD